MGTHNICHYKEVDKKYTSCILKTMELLGCVIIMLNKVMEKQENIYLDISLILSYVDLWDTVKYTKKQKKNTRISWLD